MLDFTRGTLLETGHSLVYSPDLWHSPFDGFRSRPSDWTRVTHSDLVRLKEMYGPENVCLTYGGNYVLLADLAPRKDGILASEAMVNPVQGQACRALANGYGPEMHGTVYNWGRAGIVIQDPDGNLHLRATNEVILL